MKNVYAKMILFIGWLLSPFTWWNDAFVNLPVAYLLAVVTYYLFRGNFAAYIIMYYWLTNIAGLAMVYMASRELFADKFNKNTRAKWIFAIVAYTLILAALSLAGTLKPFFPHNAR